MKSSITSRVLLAFVFMALMTALASGLLLLHVWELQDELARLSAQLLGRRQAVIDHADHLTVIAVVVPLVCLLAGLLAVLVLRRSVFGRVQRLGRLMRAHAQGAQIAVPTHGDDEIGEMSRSLAHLIREIDVRETRLREYQGGLERLVVERTAALRQTNEVLAAEVAERARAVEGMRRERQRVYELLDGLPAAVCLVDADGTVEFTNRCFRKWFGSPRHPGGADPLSFGASPDADPAQILLRAAFDAAGGPQTVRQPDGRSFEVHRLEFEAGRSADDPGKFLLLAMDVTARKQAQEAVRRLRDDLARIGKLAAMGEFAASVAHEVNQPLAAILSNAQAAVRNLGFDPPDLAEARAALDAIIRSDRRATTVIRSLRALVKGDLSATLPLDLNVLVAEVVELARDERGALGAAIDLRLAPLLPTVRGNKVQLQQALLNVITNGLQAAGVTPEATSRALVVSTADGGGAVSLAVRDFGPGMDDDRLAQAFDPFFTTRPAGLGMGLAITRSIVEAHGGTIRAERNADRGMTFRFELPSSAEEAA